jgi:hypothetical protein
MQEMSSGNSELENALKSLIPLSAGIDSIAVAFAAGRKSARGQIHFWQAAAMLLVLFAGASWLQPTSHYVAPIPHESISAVAIVQPMPHFAQQSLLMLNEVALKDGVEALPLESFPSTKSVQANDAY